MTTLVMPTNAQIQQIAQDKLPVMTQDDPIFQYFPIKTRDTSLVLWEQLDSFKGLQQIRGIGGQPPKVQPMGLKQYQAPPGYYGEYIDITERELTERRAYGTFGQSVNISELVMEKQDQLLNRRIDRIRYIAWTLASTGTFSVSA